MKKKILLLISVIAVIFIFALSVFAEEIDGVFYNLDKKNQVATVNKENKTATAEIATIPSLITYDGVEYRVTQIMDNAFDGNKTVKEIRILSEYIKAIPHGMIANTYNGALEKIYIDFSNVTSYASAALNPSNQTNGNSPYSNNFYYYDAKAFLENGTDVIVTEPDFSNVTSIGAAAFQGANFEKLTIPGTIKALNTQIFRKSTIKELVIEGDTLETIGYYAFQACAQLEKITIETSNLKLVSNDVFSACTAVKEIYIDLSKCEEVSTSAFQFATAYDSGQTRVQWYNTDGEKIVDLSSMKNFKEKCFASSNLGSAKIIWPNAIEKLESQAFRKCNINQPMLISAAEGVSINLQYWCFEGNNPTLLLCNEGVVSTAARFSGVTAVFLAPSINITDDKDVGFINGSTLYCKGLAEGSKVPGGSKCTVINITAGTINNYGACGMTANVSTANGEVDFGSVVHTTSDEINNALCPIGKVLVTSCKYCTYKYYSVDGEEVEAKAHDYNLDGSIFYEDYFELGFRTNKCVCSAEQTEEIATEEAIFVYYGYSATEEAIGGTYSMSQFFGVNQSALDTYTKATGKAFEYGVVVSANTDPMNEANKDLIEQGKTYIATQSQLRHNYIDIKVVGFNSTTLDKPLVFCMFVKDGESISYLDSGKTTETVEAKSYNEILNK